MVKTKRQLIFEDIEKTLKELRETKFVSIDKKAIALDFKTLPLDAFVVMSGTTTRIARSIGQESYVWDIDIECYTKDDPEQKIKLVYNKILQDKLRNGNTADTFMSAFDYWSVDEEAGVYGIVFTFTVIYEHPIGQM